MGTSTLRHVVLFKFKKSAGEDDIKNIIGMFLDLKNKIPYIRSIEWGTDVSVEGISRGYSHCFLLTFEDERARNRYLEHPDHQHFGDSLNPHLKTALAFDYLI